MTEKTLHEEPQVDAVTAEETAVGMTDEQLRDARDAITDGGNLTDLEAAVLTEIGSRKPES